MKAVTFPEYSWGLKGAYAHVTEKLCEQLQVRYESVSTHLTVSLFSLFSAPAPPPPHLPIIRHTLPKIVEMIAKCTHGSSVSHYYLIFNNQNVRLYIATIQVIFLLLGFVFIVILSTVCWCILSSSHTYILIHLTPTTALGETCYYYPHCKDEKTKTQRGYMICSRSQGVESKARIQTCYSSINPILLISMPS